MWVLMCEPCRDWPGTCLRPDAASSSARAAWRAGSPSPGAAGTRWWGGACGWTAGWSPRSSPPSSGTLGIWSKCLWCPENSPTLNDSVFVTPSSCQYPWRNTNVWSPERITSWLLLRRIKVSSKPEILEIEWWRHHYLLELQTCCKCQESEAGVWKW